MVFNWFRRKHNDKQNEEAAAQAQEAALTQDITETAQDVTEAAPPTSDKTGDATGNAVGDAAGDAAGETITPSETSMGASTGATAQSETGTAAGNEAYLAWAKAAFQNIQQRQQEDPATVTGSAELTEAIETATESATEASTGLIASPIEASNVTSPTVTPITAEVTPVTEATTKTTAETTAKTTAEQEPGLTVELTESTPDLAPNLAQDLAQDATAASALIAPETDAQGTTTSSDDVATDAPTVPTQPAWMRAAAERQARLDRLQETAIEESEAFTQLPRSLTDLGELSIDDDFIWSAEVLAAQGRQAEDVSLEEIQWLKKLRDGLGKTRLGLVNQLKSIVGQGPLNDDAVMEIEALLLQADVGVDATDAIISALQTKMREETLPPEEAIAYLKQILRDMLEAPFERNYDRDFSPVPGLLNIWMMTGVNGAGKTTTIGKLAHLCKSSGYDCLIAAADTFRAAAVEQVKIWGQRTNTEVIANPGKNTDPAAVVFDAIAAAQARNAQLLLVDTAGRLQNKKNLMDELSKVRRIISTKAPQARIESLLVLDATLGQNGLRQAEVFAEAAQLSGVVLTKVDGSAKGGVALAVVRQLGLPIRFIGAGEGIEDLRPFSSFEFVEALMDG